MDLEKKYKWTLTGFIIMVILNIGILITLWVNAPENRPWRTGRESQKEMHSFFFEQLQLSDAQMDTISAIRQSHFREMRLLRKELDDKRRDYIEFVLGPDSGNKEVRDSLLNVLTIHFSKMESKMYSHMEQMRRSLSEDQQATFREVMKQSLTREQQHERRRQNHR